MIDMTRSELLNEVLNLKGENWLLELATGTGKSKLALEKIKSIGGKNILLVVNRLVHIQNWMDEFNKWWPDCKMAITVTTYASFHKHIGHYDCAIFDECFRGDTQILTTRGFIEFKDLQQSDKVAQFTDNGEIEFVNPIRLIKNPYNGKLCKVHLGRNRFVYMTPGHNQVYRTKSNKEWRVKEIKDLSFNSCTEIPVSGKGVGEDKTLSTLERLFIAIQADGTLQRHQMNESVYSIQVTKGRKKKRLKSILEQYKDYTQIKGKPECDRYMVKLPKGDAKLLSTHFSINMSYEKAKLFIEEVLEWDGCHLQGKTKYYSSKIKKNADFVAAVAVQAGYKVLQSEEVDNRKNTYSTIYRVYMRPETESANSHIMYKEYLDFSGDVYCVEVPSHKIVVRSQGYTFISGNCHHLSARCRILLKSYKIKHSILCSATVNKKLKYEFNCLFKDLVVYKRDLRDVIEDDILPDPKVYLLPLELDKNNYTEVIWANPKAKGKPIECTYPKRWDYIKQKTTPVKILCTPWQYSIDLNNKIDYWKRRFMCTNSEIAKNKWLRLCSERLKWLSDKKIGLVIKLLKQLDNYRTLTFCNSIEQTELLGKYCINSKNKESINTLSNFNSNKINHITACNMLNEGINLYNCQVGIYANLNSSETIVKQRMGRLLRHKSPVIIVPYYKNTREEELVKGMLENYNPKLVNVINDIKEIKI